MKSAEVELEVFDLRGALVRRIAGGHFDPGVHTRAWDGRDRKGRPLPNGVYLLRFAADGRRETRKLVVVE
jgi:flagellar hook assembly protein FlgD